MTSDVILREATFRSWDGRDDWSVRLTSPLATHVAWEQHDVVQVLARADAASREGRYAVVAVSYDAAPAFEPAVRSAPPDGAFPLAIVAEFEASRAEAPPPPGEGEPPRHFPGPALHPDLDPDEFSSRVERVRERILAGDTYQVNLTFPMRGPAPPDPGRSFDDLCRAQHAGYAARLDLGRFDVLSLSPELFFERRGNRLTARPMKGTSPRGRWRAEDELRAVALATSTKAHAENVMIVDLLRNDIGRVADTGSVLVPALFSLERFPTVWQLTSTIEATVPAATTIVDLFRALFPCGSVTGAPKIRTMELIAELEQGPRGLYTGAIGLVRPGGDCTFSVAIRTLVIDNTTRTTVLGVGAGIIADSDPAQEYDECLLKAAFAARPAPPAEPFSLLETMRLEHGTLHRVDRHLARMHDSAVRFDYPWPESEIRQALIAACRDHPTGCWRLRLTVSSTGAVSVAATPHTGVDGVWRVAFASQPVDDQDPMLFNKTTSRRPYEIARRGRPDVDDVLLWNERGEVTESTIANIVAEIDGVKYTPPVSCGLLAGTLRAELVESGEVIERVLTRGMLARAERLWLVNSLRGWIEATLVR